MKTPPRLATALLERLGPRDEALIGDLVEEYRSGRSGTWYWRQALTAIAIGAATEVRTHPLVALRVLAIGWMSGWLYFRYVSPWVFSTLYTAVRFDELLFTTGLVRWFYLHRLGLPDVFVDFVWPVTMAFGWFVNGWLVGRTHRAHGPSMVLAYFACVTGLLILQFVWAAALGGVSMIPKMLGYGFLAGCVPILLGGLWGGRGHTLPSAAGP